MITSSQAFIATEEDIMIMLRAVPVILATAGLFAAPAAFAQTYYNGPNDHPEYQYLSAAPVLTAANGHTYLNDPQNPGYMQRYSVQADTHRAQVDSDQADKAYANGDSQSACRWIQDAQSHYSSAARTTTGHDDSASSQVLNGRAEKYCAK